MNKFYKVGVIFSLVLNVGLMGALYWMYTNEETNDTIEKNYVNTNITEFSSEVSHAIANASNTVVSIKTNKQGIFSYGSGVILSQTDGLVNIVTNAAVVYNAETIEVMFANGQSSNGIVKGFDNVTDIALIQVNVEYDVPHATLGSSQNLKLGQFISVIGASHNSLTNNASLGIVSALNNGISMDLNNDQINDWDLLTVQSDASVNTNNTGGAMVNLKGELIGIASYRLANMQGISNGTIGIGVPIEEVIVIVNQLQEYGQVNRALLGLNVLDITSLTTYQRSYLGIELDIKAGLYVSGITEVNGIGNVGLQQGDIIVSIDGKPLSGLKDYRTTLYVDPEQESISITYMRNNETETINVELSHG